MQKLNETQIKNLVWQTIVDNRPRLATGIYIDVAGFKYGFRTNKDKMPNNFILLWEDPIPELIEFEKTYTKIKRGKY